MVSDRIKEKEKQENAVGFFSRGRKKNGDHLQGYCAQGNFYFLLFILK